MLVLLRWVPQSAQGEPRFVSRGRAPPGLTQPCALCPQWFAAPGLMSSTEGWLRRDTRSPTGCPCASPAMKASCCVVMLRPGVRPTAPGSRRCPPASQVGPAPLIHRPGAGRAFFPPVTSFLPTVFLPVQCSVPQTEGSMNWPSYKRTYKVNDILYSPCGTDPYRPQNFPSTCSADGTWIPPPKCVSTTFCPGFAFCPIRSLEQHQSDFINVPRYHRAGTVEGLH